jgi:transposase
MPPYVWQRGGAKISRAGKYKTSKITALCNEDGQIQQFDIGNGGESDHKAVKRIVRHIPQNVFVTLDKGYDSKKLRRQIRQRRARPLCPRRQFKTQPLRRTPKPYIYKSRWIIEQAFSRTDTLRKLTVRYERNPYNYKQFWYLGLTWLELKKLTG